MHHNLLNLSPSRKRCGDVNKIRFGFVGAIRYPRTIFTFAKVVANKFPMHEFHFYGEGFASDQAELMCRKFDNLYYHGRFQNPKDLPLIYSEIDVNVVCYDPNSMNVRIAEPNKLYESVFFKVPIVVSEDTFLEKRVKQWGVGYSVKAYDEKEVCRFINSLNESGLNNCIDNACVIPDLELFDNTQDLIVKLKNVGL